ncbi:hypothetical protein [Candidatus Uabimicrobium sp. HlEnr_7]|uniref:hypothetical protein n=1 Tax=Candidatus Uabimicrobium helgolandensis TaxID=3095367 RepID=UPI003557ED36
MNKYLWLILFCFSIGLIVPFSFTKTRYLSQEHGLIENITVVLYFITILVTLIYFYFYRKLFLLQVVAVSMMLVARELDCHKSLVSGNVLKIKFYFASNEQIQVKLMAAIIVIFCGFYFLYLCLTYVPILITKTQEKFMGAIFSVLLIISFSYLLETVKSILRKSLVIDMTMDERSIFRYAEECLEMAIPIFICCAVFLYFNNKTAIMTEK